MISVKRIPEAVDTFKEKLAEVKAELKGEARSRARMVKQAKDVPELAERLNGAKGVAYVGAPRPIAGATIRMVDGKRMTFFNDGSLRHAHGVKPGKAARKALKRMRRRER